MAISNPEWPWRGRAGQGFRIRLPWRGVPQGRPSPPLAKDSPSLPGEKPPQPSRVPGVAEGQAARLQHGRRFGMTRSLPLSGHPRSHRECRVRPVPFGASLQGMGACRGDPSFRPGRSAAGVVAPKEEGKGLKVRRSETLARPRAVLPEEGRRGVEGPRWEQRHSAGPPGKQRHQQDAVAVAAAPRDSKLGLWERALG